MPDERNFAQRTNDSGGYVSQWIESYQRSLDDDPRDANAPKMTIADILNHGHNAAQPQAGTIVPSNRSGAPQTPGAGAQPQPEEFSGVRIVDDGTGPPSWEGTQSRAARNDRAAEEGDQPSYYKNGA